MILYVEMNEHVKSGVIWNHNVKSSYLSEQMRGERINQESWVLLGQPEGVDDH